MTHFDTCILTYKPYIYICIYIHTYIHVHVRTHTDVCVKLCITIICYLPWCLDIFCCAHTHTHTHTNTCIMEWSFQHGNMVSLQERADMIGRQYEADKEKLRKIRLLLVCSMLPRCNKNNKMRNLQGTLPCSSKSWTVET